MDIWSRIAAMDVRGWEIVEDRGDGHRFRHQLAAVKSVGGGTALLFRLKRTLVEIGNSCFLYVFDPSGANYLPRFMMRAGMGIREVSRGYSYITSSGGVVTLQPIPDRYQKPKRLWSPCYGPLPGWCRL